MIYARYQKLGEGQVEIRSFVSESAYIMDSSKRDPWIWSSVLLGAKHEAVLGEDGPEEVYFKQTVVMGAPHMWWLFDMDGNELAYGEVCGGKVYCARFEAGMDPKLIAAFVEGVL